VGLAPRVIVEQPTLCKSIGHQRRDILFPACPAAGGATSDMKSRDDYSFEFLIFSELGVRWLRRGATGGGVNTLERPKREPQAQGGAHAPPQYTFARA
jgi:hypothetical protein